MMEEQSIFIAGRIYQRIIDQYNLIKTTSRYFSIEHGIDNSVNIQEVVRVLAEKLGKKSYFNLVPLKHGFSLIITVDFS